VLVTVVTLLVGPAEAEALTLAATEGKIQLALRNTLDVDSVRTNGIQINSLVRRPTTAAPSPTTAAASEPVPSTTVIESYKGGSRTLVKFNKKGG
jgi:pilus assembly protein CpaB